MSAMILFRLVKPPEGHISVGTEGMAAVVARGASSNPHQQIIDQIQREDGTTCAIEVWAEW